jgi:hypothetical protein
MAADFVYTKRLYTLEEVAELTGFLLEPLKEDVRADRIEHVHRGRERYMTPAQIDKLIAQHTKKATNPTKSKLTTNAAGREVDVDAWTARKLAALDRRAGAA